ncbi:hypothetical protein CIB84_005105 [Bambusicola thoracicus]|uniref:Apovitellenin-1 n=1 Tax=Bambusicola thoracicus TaxID=9083 RepID=A0A2P4T451_BAMTH|nr:hypothetical protein CIB84_005105 [Bambusicola thoracicus]
MVQYRALVIVVLLLLSTTVPEVHSKSISDRGRRDWLVTLDAAAAYIYESVYKLSPKAAQFLLDASRNAYVSSIRYGKRFCASVAIAMGRKGEGEVGKRTD